MLYSARVSALVAATLAFAAAGLAGCSAPAADAPATTGEDAYTVEGGDKFVHSVQGDTVVLRKTVGSAVFPFAPSELEGKAILIHPVAGKTETGVYARVKSVEERAGAMVLDTTPLTFDEMEATAEEDVVRIYMDRDLPRVDVQTQAIPLPLAPAAAGALRPLGWGGALTGTLDFGVSGPIEPGESVGAGFLLSREDTRFSLVPEARARWQRGRGFELGFRGQLGFDTTLAFKGSVSRGATIFETPKVKSPRAVVLVVIGWVPVPITLGVNGNMACSVSAAASLEGKLDIHLAARVGGSSFIQPSRRTPIDQWVSAGEWPYEASAEASVTPRDFRLQGTVGVTCNVPRVELETLIAGLTGPYVAVVPQLGLSTNGETITPTRKIRLMGGVRASAFGFADASAEVELLSWSPE